MSQQLQTDESLLIWNVIGEEAFKSKNRTVFRMVSDVLANTLGPYGATTIIEKFGETHFTKDGWHILKRLKFREQVADTILQLLTNISAQVVIKVGDGSTSSIIAADQVMQKLENDPSLLEIRQKDMIKLLADCVLKISEYIQNHAVKIDKETDPKLDQIYKIALISTNGDKELSEIICKIYEQTDNPFIEYTKSKTNRTHFEVASNAYQSNFSFLDRIYVNNENGTCDISKPYILMFDHAIDHEHHYKKVIHPVLIAANQQGRRVVVIAPHYDSLLLQAISDGANTEMRANGSTAAVYVRATLTSNRTHNMYNDFAILSGARVIKEQLIGEIVNEGTVIDVFGDYVGHVDHISIGSQTTTAKGFPKRDENMYKVALDDATSQFKKVEETHREMNIVSSELYELKKRIAKLRCVMGTIYVGGNSHLEKTTNYDAVEDAVKACESAYNYGYNIGGNLIIPVAIKHILEENSNITEEEKKVYALLDSAFRGVFARVIRNKYKNTPSKISDDAVDGIIETAVDQEICYDLTKDEFSNDVINPCFTDIEILNATTSIVSMLYTSSQYLTIDMGDRHEDR